MPEGRREPFKETFLCLKKKREIERERERKGRETWKHTTKSVGWPAGWLGCTAVSRRRRPLGHQASGLLSDLHL